MPRIAILNGPNLNLLGQRQPEIYGSDTLADVERACAVIAGEIGADIRFFQSNAEHQLVDWIQAARSEADAIVINAAAYTHTSIAILDALLAFDGPVVEVHISNPNARESWRHLSVIAPVATGTICGFGTNLLSRANSVS